MMKKTLVLHSPLSPGAASEALRCSIDEEHRTIFSLSGFQGSRPVVGEVGIDSFRLRKRIRYRNDFARLFYGRFEPESAGTRIEGHFAIRRFPKIFMTIWFAGAISIGTIAFVSTVRDLLQGSRPIGNNTWMGFAFPLGLILFGIGLLWFCRMLSRPGERFILEHLKSTLSARTEKPDSLIANQPS